MSGREIPPTIGSTATLACLLEVTIPKPGNVHRGADFENTTFMDFATSAAAIGPVMDRACQASLGATVLAAVATTQRSVQQNTNLGMILLLAPLCQAAGHGSNRDTAGLKSSLSAILAGTDGEDARQVYEAIRLARPGGLGQVNKSDVHAAPPDCLIEAMRLAADRDLIARQYVTGFATVFDSVVPGLVQAREKGASLTDAVIQTHLQLMAEHPDSLIRRKCGEAIALQAAAMARDVIHDGPPGTPTWHAALRDLDFWLRSDGHKRNPGTTADLIAAGLFVGLWLDEIRPPFA